MVLLIPLTLLILISDASRRRYFKFSLFIGKSRERKKLALYGGIRSNMPTSTDHLLHHSLLIHSAVNHTSSTKKVLPSLEEATASLAGQPAGRINSKYCIPHK